MNFSNKSLLFSQTTRNIFSIKFSMEKAQPYIVCSIAALFLFYEFVQLNMFNVIGQDLMRKFSIDATGLGSLSAAYFYANVLFLVPAGLLLDRISTRKLIMFAMGICILGTFLLTLPITFFLAKACRFFTGIGGAFCFISTIRLASRWFPVHKLAFVTGLIYTAAMLGGVVSQTPLIFLVQKIGWHNALLVDVSAGIIMLIMIRYFVKDFPMGKAIEKIPASHFLKNLKASLFNSASWLAGVYSSLMNLPVFVLGALYGVPYLVQARHLSAAGASYITTMIFVGTIVGAPLIGWCSDRMKTRKIPMLLGAVLALLSIILIISLPKLQLTTFIILFFFLGFFASTQALSYPSLVESNPKHLVGGSSSVVSFCIVGGGAIFQVLFGLLMDMNWNGLKVANVPVYSANDYKFALFMLPAAFFVATIIALVRKETANFSSV